MRSFFWCSSIPLVSFSIYVSMELTLVKSAFLIVNQVAYRFAMHAMLLLPLLARASEGRITSVHLNVLRVRPLGA